MPEHKPFTRALLALLTAALVACAPNFAPKRPLIQPSTVPLDPAKPAALISRFELRLPPEHIYGQGGLNYVRTSFAHALRNSGAFSEVHAYAAGQTPANGLPPLYVDLQVRTEFHQHFPWVWYLGHLAMPVFWPAQPRQGDMSIQLQATLVQNGIELQRLELRESDHFRMFWYGPYRYHEIQGMADELAQKLLTQLSQSLHHQIPVAQGIRSDIAPEQLDGNGETPPAPRRHSVAVVELEGQGIAESEARTLTVKLRSELLAAGTLDLLERERMADILAEQGFQQAACTSSECLIQMGQLVGVDMLVAGSVGKVGDVYLISLRTIDVDSGRILAEASQEIHGDISKVLTQGVGAAARQLARDPALR